MKLRNFVLVAALAAPGFAMAAQCDPELEKANGAIATGPKATVSAEDFEKARSLITEGTSLLASGDDVGCVVAVGQALDLLDMGGEEG